MLVTIDIDEDLLASAREDRGPIDLAALIDQALKALVEREEAWRSSSHSPSLRR